MEAHINKFETLVEYQSREKQLPPPHVSLVDDDKSLSYVSSSQNGNVFVNGYEFVDLGLSVKWATCNIGAKSPTEEGYFFQWAGTTAYDVTRTPINGGSQFTFQFKGSPYWVRDEGLASVWSKYHFANSSSSTGIADNKMVLDMEDDAAHVFIGGGCRMPTEKECQELLDACTTHLTNDNHGMNPDGQLLTLKNNPEKTLFFPVTGECNGASYGDPIGCGFYWSSSIGNIDSYYGKCLGFYFEDFSLIDKERYIGMPIRAVLPN